MTRQELTNKLSSGVYNITFTKVDGSIRTMPCTLHKDLIPVATLEESISQKKTRNVNENVMVVFCTDKQEWRSFRLANVLQVTEAGV